MPVQVESEKVLISHPSGSSAQIYLYGATVTSWKVSGEERLFVSQKSILNGTKAIRGGIPIVFPVFGTKQEIPLPQHGFARISKWRWLGTSVENNDEVTVEFGLDHTLLTAQQQSQWPHSFNLRYTVSLLAKSLKTTLEVHNESDHSIKFDTLLHTYFNVSDVTKASIFGLHNKTFHNKVKGGIQAKETRDKVTIAEEVDSVYVDVGDELHIDLSEGKGIKINKFEMRDTVVWNPWVDKAKSMADFGDDEYPHMLCVEVGSVAEGISLSVGEKWSGGQILTVI